MKRFCVRPPSQQLRGLPRHIERLLRGASLEKTFDRSQEYSRKSVNTIFRFALDASNDSFRFGKTELHIDSAIGRDVFRTTSNFPDYVRIPVDSASGITGARTKIQHQGAY